MDALTLTGAVLRPADAGYDDARRVFNGMIDRYPALIARCSSTADVVAAVRHARANDLPIAVHGGGHGVTGAAVCDDGMMIDLRGLSDVEVDPYARCVACGGGTNWGQFDAATTAHGLIVPGGRVPSTGVGGLTLGSGSSWLERKFGLTCDSLRSVELVTADGDVVTASQSENAELFWGLRGGSGNFGVVTRFEFDAHPIPPLLFAGMLMFPHERAAEVLAAYRTFMAGAPDEVGGAAAFISAPPEDFVPEPVRGKPVFGIVVAYAGEPDEGRRVFAPLLDLGPAVAMVDDMPYVALQRLLEPACPSGLQNYWSADFLDRLPDDAIDVLVEHTARVPAPHTQVIVIPGGGAIRRVPEDAMAFGERDAPWNVHFLSMWGDPAENERNIEWTRALSRAMDAYKRPGRVYLNFIGDEGAERVRGAFGPEKFARLQALKDEWDPENAFRLNQNIPPSGRV